MSYHRFTNLRETFQGDLSKKLTEGVQSINFMDRPCNCRPGKTGGCQYGGVCRKSIVVYEITCKKTGKVYIGNTQQEFKTRMRQHFEDVKKLVKTGKNSDSYARHFASLWPPEKGTPSSGAQREEIECRVLWQGNPINATKSFGKHNCTLCNRERLEIIKRSRFKPGSIINSCSEIYGACRHKTKFHRYDEKQ